MVTQDFDELKKLMDNLDTFVAKLDRNGVVLFCNKALLRATAVTYEDVYGKKFADTKWFSHSKTERANIIAFLKEAATGHSTRTETNIRSADDSPVPIIFNCNPIKDNAGRVEYISVEGKAIREEIELRTELFDALKESEVKYRELVQNANSIIMRRDVSGHITYFNEFAQSFFGYSKDEILGKNVVGIIMPETDSSGRDLAAMIEDIGRHPEKYIRNENENMRRNNERVWISWTNKAIHDDQGRIVEILSVGNDLTEHKRMHDALRESEEKYRTLIENIQDGVFVIQDAKLKFINEAFAKIVGCTVEEIIGRHFREFVAPEDLQMVSDRHSRRLAGEDVPTEYEFHCLKKDGVTKIIVNMTVGLISYQGKVTTLGTLKDITRRKLMQRELADERERLAVTLRSIGDGVIATDEKGNVVLVNQVAEKLIGWSQKEALDKHLNEVFHIVDETSRKSCENPVEEVIEHGGVVGLANNTILIARDGTERAIADSGAPILDKDGKIAGVVLVFRDVTEKLKCEQELLKADKLESVGILAGGIAHDFNNILTSILGNIALAGIYAEPEKKILDKLKRAERACIRAKNLTRQLLTFSRGGEPVKGPVAIGGLIKESASFVLSGSNVRCDCSFPPDLWLVDADEGQMDQAVNNLLINADQAMPEGGIIEIRGKNIVVEADGHTFLRKGKYVEISMQDHGIGISKGHLSRIFDPYFSTKQKGSGLGLATSHSIIKNHEGHISVESDMGVGTVFHIYLPALEEKQEIRRGRTVELIKGSKKILLMDDEEIILEVVSEILRGFGYEVELAGDGKQAVDMYEKAVASDHPFDAVIMDLTVPGGMGGKEAIEKLRQIDPDVKAIVSSGYSTDPVMSDFRKYGFCAMITKPFKIEDMNEILIDVINS